MGASDTPELSGPMARFDVLAEVGQGAAGVVFRAFDRELGEQVALKVMALPPGADPEQLLREGRLLARIVHPAIVRIVDFGTFGPEPVALCGRRFERGTPYLAMEWLRGQDLQRRQVERPLALPQCLDVGRQVAGALCTVHEAGIAHRDIKPSNVFLEEVGPVDSERLSVKVVDFGVAVGGDPLASDFGPLIGTPAYMSPEQARGDASLDVRCDVYSLGAMLFELVAGRPPHAAPSSVAMLAKLVSTPAPRLSELLCDVPQALDDLLADMLQPDARSRPSAAEVAERLTKLYSTPDLPRSAVALERGLESVHSSASRLVTTMVALHVGPPEQREAELHALADHGVEAVRLGADSLVAFLGARRAVGDEAVRALELGQRLAGLGAQVGVATGRALVDLARPAGLVVDQASALARDAAGGALLTDDITTELARERFQFTPGPRGASCVAPLAAERRAGRELAPFVGREAELEMAVDALEGCFSSATPTMVSCSGPPGIGKSRLGRELVRAVAARRGGRVPSDPPPRVDGGVPRSLRLQARWGGSLRVVLVRSEAYGRASALGMAADALGRLLDLDRGAGRAAAVAALSPYRLGRDEVELLSSLLARQPLEAGVDPQRARDLLYVTMTGLVLRSLAEEPALFVLEDAQWADPESIAWFDHLLARAAGQPLGVLLLTRPSFWKDHPDRFAGRDHRHIELRPISRRATMEIARSIMGCAQDDPKLEEIARQAAGSPLFAEELARVMATGKPVASVPTIEAAIQVSLDALPEALRGALTRMSIFGLTAWDAGLTALGVAAAGEALAKLAEAELVVEQERSRFPGTREYLFKHALVRDVCYASVSEALRTELHAKVGGWLAEIGEDAARIAEHYDLGGEHVCAAGYWELAATRALLTNALQDAVRMADRALTFAEGRESAFARAMLLDEVHSRLDERSSERSDAVEAMNANAYDEASEVRALGARARYDHARSAGHDVEERLREAAQRSARLGLLDEEARCAATLAARHAFAGDFPLAEQTAAHLLELAERPGVEAAAVDAHQTLAVVHQTRGQLAEALEDRRNAAKAARLAGLKQREATLTINLGFALTTIGARDEARRIIQGGIRMAEEIGSAGTVRLGCMILLGWAAHFGADPSLDAALSEPRESADEAATGVWLVKDRVTLGTLFYRGCELLREPGAGLRRARALLQISTEAYRTTENRDVLPVAMGYWAEACRRLGEVDQAAQLAQEAADLVEAGAPSLLNEAIIYLALHSARVQLGDLAGARSAIERAMPPFVRRVTGLKGTSYVRDFLRGLEHNVALLEAADRLGRLPEEIDRLLQG